MPLFRFITLEAIAYVIAWVAFPLLMASLARLLDRDDYYIRYIVAYNWAAVLQNLLYIPIAILAAAGVLSIALSNTLGLMALALIVAYTWFITRTALEVAAGMAAGIVEKAHGAEEFRTEHAANFSAPAGSIPTQVRRSGSPSRPRVMEWA